MISHPLNIGNAIPVPPAPQLEKEIMAGWKGDISTPMVSIVCHTYNHVDYIENALDGFLMQETQFPFEIIIHDDASSDGTTKIVERYAEDYPKIIVPIIQTTNQWSQGKRPSLFTHPITKGKYIAFCEGDDYWLDKYKLQTQFDILEHSKGICLSYHDAICINEKGVITGFNLATSKNYSDIELKNAPFIPTLTRFYINEKFTWLSDPSLPVAGDVVMATYLSRFGGAKFADNLLPAVYRHHEGGVWSKDSDLEKTRMTIDAMLFIANKYYMESEIDTSNLFLEKAFVLGIQKLPASTSLIISLKMLYHSSKKLSGKVKGKINYIRKKISK